MTSRRPVISLSCLLPALSLFSALCLLPFDAQAGPLARRAIKRIDQIVSAYMTKQEIPGLSIAVALDGEIVWTNGYGLADLENSVAARADTVYRSASIGKAITATAAMRLVEQGKLDLDKPVQQYCPAFPVKQWPLTTRHLLSHLGGIRHYGGPHDAEEQTSTIHYPNVTQALTPFKDDPLLFEPGTDYTYSTYGYDVVGCVLEGAGGAPFMDLIRSLVFEPAGMAQTRDDDPFAIIPHRAAGYTKMSSGALRNATHIDMSNRLPAGGYATTAADLARFGARFIDCKLVSCATRDLMLTETALKNGDTVNYGIGWSIAEDASGKPTGAASHGGSTPGVSGIIWIVPKRRISLVFLTNLEDLPERPATAEAILDALSPSGES